MIQGVKENLEQPGAAIGADFELIERLPRLQVNVLHGVVRRGPVSEQAGRGAVDVAHVRHRGGFEFLGARLFREEHRRDVLSSRPMNPARRPKYSRLPKKSPGMRFLLWTGRPEQRQAVLAERVDGSGTVKERGDTAAGRCGGRGSQSYPRATP